MSDESVSRWIEKLRDGSESAAEKLWNRYFSKLVQLSRSYLRNAPRQAEDEEDVVLAAFEACFRAIKQGKYPELAHREDFLYLLIEITQNKAKDQLHRIFARKRGGHDGVAEKTPFYPEDDQGRLGAVGEALSREPTPEFASMFADEYRRLLALLDDDRLRKVVELKLAGHTNAEIGVQLGRSEPSVERYLRLIRETWGSELTDE